MKNFFKIFILFTVIACYGCMRTNTVESSSGVKMASTKVQTDTEGHTVEQRNVKERLERDNKAGSIKYLYLVSSFTGDLILQSTVKGKVTSSSKRLTPSDLTELTDQTGTEVYKRVYINGRWYATNQNPGDDGTYGDSIPYLYWFDQNDAYHQAYTGAVVVHISDQPQTFYKTIQRTKER